MGRFSDASRKPGLKPWCYTTKLAKRLCSKFLLDARKVLLRRIFFDRWPHVDERGLTRSRATEDRRRKLLISR